jgi:hypothetical protein
MLSFVRDHRGRDRMVGGFTQSVSITIHAVSSNTFQCEVYSIQHFQQYFSYIMATSLVVEEAGVPGENHRPWASNCGRLTFLLLSLS